MTSLNLRHRIPAKFQIALLDLSFLPDTDSPRMAMRPLERSSSKNAGQGWLEISGRKGGYGGL
jgi:hypothetical protein